MGRCPSNKWRAGYFVMAGFEDAQRNSYREEVDWFLPSLLSTTYSHRMREYLTEVERKLIRKQATG